ncbi:MAG TPA: hypothetical protein VMY40_15025 [Anaerolineae bacterium]|nr:hypothetical protein [Anaerolineae bacterium]
MLAPNIPLRAGGSGPLVNLTTYLNQLAGFVAVRRVWTDRGAGAVIVPAETVPPGVAIASVDVEWTAEEVALADRLAYLCIVYASSYNVGSPSAYPQFIQTSLSVTAAGGAPQSVLAETQNQGRLAPGVDFTFRAWGSFPRLLTGGNFPAFALGTNVLATAINNPGDAEDITAGVCNILVAELVGDAAQFSAT